MAEILWCYYSNEASLAELLCKVLFICLDSKNFFYPPSGVKGDGCAYSAGRGHFFTILSKGMGSFTALGNQNSMKFSH